MGPRGNWVRDLLAFQHGYDLHLVISLGVGLSWMWQRPSRTWVPAYAALNSVLSHLLPFYPMRLLGGVLVVLGIAEYVGCRRWSRIGFYAILGQTLFWCGMVMACWWGAFNSNAGFSAIFFFLGISLTYAQYLRIYQTALSSRDMRLPVRGRDPVEQG